MLGIKMYSFKVNAHTVLEQNKIKNYHLNELNEIV